MKKLLIILMFIPAGVLFAQKKRQVKTMDPFAGLDTAFQRVLKDLKAVGFAVAVVNKDKVIYAKGFGLRDKEKKLPVTPNTLFAIGSCTKAFTASLLGMLNKDGKVDFDKSPINYLPELRFYNKEMDGEITVRDMMTHRTGLPRHDYSWYLFRSSSRDSLMKRIKYMEPTAAVRQIFQYNNFMFLLQGMITEKLTGKSWEENVKEKIFTPLGMNTSNFSVHTLEKVNDASLGYTVIKDSIIKKLDYYDIDAMGPAGSINSSVNDMSNWVITWINGGKFNGKEILPAGYVSQAMSSQMVAASGFPDKEIPDAQFSNYGFGWFLTSYRGHYRVEHGGNIDGFSASTSFFPTDSIGIIVLTNQNASAVPGIVRNIIADRVLDLKPIDWTSRADSTLEKARKAAKEAEKSKISNKKPGTHLSHDLKDYTGLFNNPGYGTMEAYLRNDSLFIHIPNGDIWLRHFHYDVFEPFDVDKEKGIDTTDKNDLKIQYHMNPAGDIDMISMPLQPGIKDIEFNRIPKPEVVTKEELKRYEGSYEFAPGMEAKFYIKGENTLYAFVEGQPEYELVPVGKDQFDFKALKGYSIRFEENGKGEIISASFIQPNGTFKATKKK
ncbi:MAG: penicillin-binding protein [Sphingobacteriales bacterium UTBCD1]|jgi:CubicO group peptidase (beta-lactamase class C family)|nr:MAG: penicillin-binding protein [Sphingobacteriales bacterium UTBCD1]